jgi:AcrR family transcriptional regulator
MTYHHGNLRDSLLDAAAQVLASAGPDGLNLRELARQLGVSHTAPRHHFGDRRGLITAVAARGYDLLASSLQQAGSDFLEAGVAYVAFALDHPGHFSVMFRPDIVDTLNPELMTAQTAARAALAAGAAEHATATGRPQPAGPGTTLQPYALLAWSAAHGLASLALAGSLSAMGLGDSRAELLAAARNTLLRLDPTAT